ncbi:MAG: T9SS type A sorting domain-containing protein [Flavobacteriaceae bacterium]|nr:T9SS type A sorting domain-containing protein [Flavobacteriaceae bacterium]
MKIINNSITIFFIICFATTLISQTIPFDQNIGASPDDNTSGEIPNIMSYYIDPDGNDNADGLSPQTAWKTLNNLSNKYFSAGEGVLFKRGGYWNGTATMPFQGSRQGTASNPIVFSAYGTGARPIIDFTMVQTPVWTSIGNGVYTTPLVAVASQPLRRMYVDGNEVLDATSYAELISREGYMFWHDSNADLLYIQFNPTGKEIKYSTTRSFIYFGSGSKYITVSDLDIRGAKFSLQFPITENVVIKNNNLGEASYMGISITGNNHTITKNTIDSKRALFDYADASSTAHGPHEGLAMKGINNNATVSYNTIRNWAHSSMVSGGNINTGLNFHHNYIDGSNLAYGTKFELYSGTSDVEVWNNYFYKTTRQQIGGETIHIHHNIFDSMKNTPLKTYNTGQAIGIYDFGSESTSNAIIENNVFINSDGAAIVFSSSGSYIGLHIIRNNIMYNNGKDGVTYPGNPLGIAIQIKGNSLEDSQFYNNLIYSDLSTKVLMTGQEQTGPTYTVAEFDSANLPNNNDGFDNLQADPLFEDVENLVLMPSSNSLAIGAGVEPLSIQDWDGNIITAPYDIGIYNYQTLNIDDVNQTIFNVFPNPSKNIIYISSNTVIKNISIYEINGKLINYYNIDRINNNLIPINIENLHQGVYLLKLRIESRNYIKKIIKQ